MQRIILIGITLLTGLALLAGHLYRQENVIPQESDLKRYPELLPFQPGRAGFQGVRFNIDTNEYSFAFPVRYRCADMFFTKVDQAASDAGWSSKTVNNLEKLYWKTEDPKDAPSAAGRVHLRYDQRTHEVTLTRTDH